MMEKFLYNPRKCTSTRSLNGCIHRFSSKAIIAFPTQTEIVDLFEQTVIGGFSCINMRFEFDLKVLLPKDPKHEPKKNLKLIYKIRNEEKNISEDKSTPPSPDKE